MKIMTIDKIVMKNANGREVLSKLLHINIWQGKMHLHLTERQQSGHIMTVVLHQIYSTICISFTCMQISLLYFEIDYAQFQLHAIINTVAGGYEIHQMSTINVYINMHEVISSMLEIHFSTLVDTITIIFQIKISIVPCWWNISKSKRESRTPLLFTLLYSWSDAGGVQ